MLKPGREVCDNAVNGGTMQSKAKTKKPALIDMKVTDGWYMVKRK
jgi:hypothetical protein